MPVLGWVSTACPADQITNFSFTAMKTREGPSRTVPVRKSLDLGPRDDLNFLVTANPGFSVGGFQLQIGDEDIDKLVPDEKPWCYC